MEKNHQKSKVIGGLLVIVAGILVLLHQMHLPIPKWLLSWEMILIAIGFVMLIKHNFQKTGAYIMILIGGVFMLKDFYPTLIETRFVWPVLIIVFGISMLLKNTKWSSKKKLKAVDAAEDLKNINSDDYVNSASLFSGITKRVVSKNFKGASISSIFGGNEINLSQADFSGEAVIDITCVFGGVTLIVPSQWKVKSDLTSVFGGIDDQRPIMVLESISEDKLLVLKGSCVFGGIEILSYN